MVNEELNICRYQTTDKCKFTMILAISSGLSPSRSNLKVTIFLLWVSSWHSATLSPRLEIFTQMNIIRMCDINEWRICFFLIKFKWCVITLRTLSLALEIFSWRDWLRTERLWCRFAERPSWRPPPPPSLPSLRPDSSECPLSHRKWGR